MQQHMPMQHMPMQHMPMQQQLLMQQLFMQQQMPMSQQQLHTQQQQQRVIAPAYGAGHFHISGAGAGSGSGVIAHGVIAHGGHGRGHEHGDFSPQARDRLREELDMKAYDDDDEDSIVGDATAETRHGHVPEQSPHSPTSGAPQKYFMARGPLSKGAPASQELGVPNTSDGVQELDCAYTSDGFGTTGLG